LARFRYGLQALHRVSRHLAMVVLALASISVVGAAEPGSTGVDQTLYAFQGRVDGAFPFSNLIGDASGAIFGTVSVGGGRGEWQDCSGQGCGAVFKLTPGPSGYTETIVYGFAGPLNHDGTTPHDGVIEDANGSLYGTAADGGSKKPSGSGCGIVFKLTPAGSRYTERILYRFKGGNDGCEPYAGLVADSQGNLFGTTIAGGGSPNCTSGCGTVFELRPAGERYRERVLLAFDLTNGAVPYAGLIIDSKGVLYGTTSGGGDGCQQSNCGVVFSLSPRRAGGHASYAERVLYAFRGGSDGSGPLAAPMEDAGGALYGTTTAGGGTACNSNRGCGTAYRLTPVGSGYAETVIYSFSPPGKPEDGFFPESTLVVGKNGALYGTTLGGGSGPLCHCGTVFKLVSTPHGYVERIVHSFHGKRDGAFPFSGLLVKADGSLLGTTEHGGNGANKTCGFYGCGVVFDVTP
jgi:uncharacterized repeat protein (TIGR03803 family)